MAKVSADGSHLVYSSYLGGANDDHGAAIAVDASGSAYVTGSTWSSNFPGGRRIPGRERRRAGCICREIQRGRQYAPVQHVSRRRAAARWVIRKPGRAIALDGSGNVYIAGATSSSQFSGAQCAADFAARRRATPS